MQVTSTLLPFTVPLRTARALPAADRPRAIDLRVHGLIVRSVRPADIDHGFMSSLASHPLDSYIVQPGEPLSPEFLKHRLDQFDEVHAYLLSVVDAATQALLGLVRLQVNRMHRVAHLIPLFDMTVQAYEKHLLAWLPALAEELFARHDIAKISMNVLDRKTALIQALNQCGLLDREGVLSGEQPGPDGQRHDVTVYGLLNPNNLPKP